MNCALVSLPLDTATPYQLLAGPLSVSCTQRYGINSLSQTSDDDSIIPVATLTSHYNGIQTTTYVQTIDGEGSSVLVQLLTAGSTLYWQQLGEPGLPTPPPPVYTLAWAPDGTPDDGTRASGTYFQVANFSADVAQSVKSNQQLTLLPADPPPSEGDTLPLAGMRAYLLLAPEDEDTGEWVSGQSVLFATPEALADALASGLVVGRPLGLTWTFFTTFPIQTRSRIPDACVQLCI
jgi:hypothetical protein